MRIDKKKKCIYKLGQNQVYLSFQTKSKPSLNHQCMTNAECLIKTKPGVIMIGICLNLELNLSKSSTKPSLNLALNQHKTMNNPEQNQVLICTKPVLMAM